MALRSLFYLRSGGATCLWPCVLSFIFAPEERHVYSLAFSLLSSLRRSDMFIALRSLFYLRSGGATCL